MAERALVLSPHPDDDAIGCGGTLREHVVIGDEVKLIVLTSGESGGHGHQSPQETAMIREAEAQAASQILGISEIEFWRQPDGRLSATDQLVDRLRLEINTWKPTRIYAPHPQEMHADHQATTTLLARAIDKLPGDRPNMTMRLYEVWTPIQQLDEIIDITAHVETKLAAIRAHRTQVNAMRLDEAAIALNRYRGEMHCWPGGEYAEAFCHLISTENDRSTAT